MISGKVIGNQDSRPRQLTMAFKGGPIMIKRNIINMEEFLRTVNRCKGAVYMVEPGTGKTDITGQDEIQEYLRRKHRDNKGYLPLVLEIPVPADYMSIINFYAGDL